MTNIIEPQLEKVAELCRRSGARRLEIFGSAVRLDFNPMSSDLDFLLEFDDLPPTRYADAYFLLKKSLEALFGRQIDPETGSEILKLARVVGFRNVLVHGYTSLDNRIVWDVIETNLSALLTSLESLLAQP